jgi:proteasome lid subunit RPN8/RPN11
MQTSVAFPLSLINRILAQAAASPTAEVCGLVAGREGRPTRCIPIDNIASQPRQAFALDPRQQIAALRQMREQGETLFAIYHSHPDTPALPSAKDLEQAAYPDSLYLIVSLGTTGTLQLRGFHFAAGAMHPVDILVADEIPL